jgi:hypothetical protein
MGCGLVWLGRAALKTMTALRTYQITADDLDRLHLAMEQQARERRETCVHCGADLCDEHQKAADLLQQLADAVSMNAAGMSIVFTTQQAEAEQKQSEQIIQ